MKKYLGVLLALLMGVLALIAPVSAQAAPAPAADGTQVWTYADPVLRAPVGPQLLWDGPNGELVYVTNYIQTIDGSGCPGPDGVRAATNYDCYKYGVRANCGAELTNSVEDYGGLETPLTVYDCSNSPPDSCFGSSGPDGKHTTYSAWRNVSDWHDGFKGHLYVRVITVQGVSSGSNHHSMSGWTY